MKSKLDHALALAAEGFHVFPLEAGTKVPRIDDFPNRASRDPEQIRRWWRCPVMGIVQDFNVAISTTCYQDDSALMVVDVDNKGEKHGDDTIAALAGEGLVLPDTLETRTPTGGRHLFYRVPAAVRQGAGVLGAGVDTRSRGGYVVGPGSTLGSGEYVTAKAGAIADAPDWLIDKCGRDTSGPRRAPDAAQDAVVVDPIRAKRRAYEYLKSQLPVTEGERNHKGYAVACKLKDFGVTEADAPEFIAQHWKCEPPLDAAELAHVVRSAYRYGREAPGSAAPEVQFQPVFKEGVQQNALSTNSGQAEKVDIPHPFEKLNREFAFALAGGGHHILWETEDASGNKALEHLSESAFHKRHASQLMQVGKRTQPVTELWMGHDSRRSYDGLCFVPGKESPPRFYNLWRGFAVDPAPAGSKHKAVDAFLEHAHKNVCHGNTALYAWLIGFFAHMIQKPWEKPLVALVFRGSKGVGKNALIERIGALLGSHFLLTSNRRYLVGNFNGHLENCLLFALDEAFWSGDKQAEGTLKDLITGKSHVIEHKGKEPFTVANKTRVAILGNENWLVPASHDERRFAVFDVGEGRKQDRAYFQAMREGMERGGGYAVLLRYLMDFPLSGFEPNEAPSTKALLDQKHASLEPIQQWWHESLSEGALAGGDFEGWPEEAETARLRNALSRYFREHQIRSRVPPATTLGKVLKELGVSRGRSREGAVLSYVYKLPSLPAARAGWGEFIGHDVEWEK